MGWFDQETKEGPATPTAARPTPSQPAAQPASTPAGSTIGQRVQVSGTVISDEDLEIVGKVEGTIKARKGLRVAEQAQVQAVINGANVLIEGTVVGDINASTTLVLGTTASLTGNIKTPSLQIREGAFFKGQVTMQQEVKADEKSAKPAAAEATKAGSAPSAGKPGAGRKPQPGDKPAPKGAVPTGESSAGGDSNPGVVSGAPGGKKPTPVSGEGGGKRGPGLPLSASGDAAKTAES